MTIASSGGRRKSSEIVGKSLLISAGSSEGFSADRDRRYNRSPASMASRKSPNGFLMYSKFFDTKFMCSVDA